MRTLLNRLCAALVFALISSVAGAQESAKLDPDLPYQGVKSAPVTYQGELSAVVTPPYKAKVLKVWMPSPPSDAIQQVKGSTFTTYPIEVEPKIGTESGYGNELAYFEFRQPQGAQMIRHKFAVRTHQVNWSLDPAHVPQVKRWPEGFQKYMRGEPLIPIDERVQTISRKIVPDSTNAVQDPTSVMRWVNSFMTYSHEDCSLQGSAVHALEKKMGHCSDYHGLCNSLARSLG